MQKKNKQRNAYNAVKRMRNITKIHGVSKNMLKNWIAKGRK